MEKKTKYRLSGVAAGLTNGIFGGGGGIPLLVLLTKWAGVEEKKAFATCVAVIFPMCAVSAALWYWRAELSLTAALPYLLGGFAGGLVGGKLFKKVPNLWLRRIFALFLLYGGWRYLFTGRVSDDGLASARARGLRHGHPLGVGRRWRDAAAPAHDALSRRRPDAGTGHQPPLLPADGGNVAP